MTLQDRWPTLSPRERDAMVARAKGWTVTEQLKGMVTYWHCVPKDGGQATDLQVDRGSGIKSEFAPAPGKGDWIPNCSSEWADAGRLLEEMLAAGLHVELFKGTEGMSILTLDASRASARGCFDGSDHPSGADLIADSFPPAICLAYCAWKGVEP
jgi:hypothetical protein